MKHIAPNRIAAFTRAELLVVIVVVAMLAAVVIAGYPRQVSKRDRIECVNNQKQIGTAFRVFASDGSDGYPLQNFGSYYIVPSNATPMQVNSPSAATWQAAQAMWESIQSPKLLLCPSDRERSTLPRVTDFNGLAGNSNLLTTASLGHPSNQNNSVSYAFGVAAEEARPLGILIVDRNVNNVGLAGAGVLSNVALTSTRTVLNGTPGPTQAVWVKGTRMHGMEGNLAYADGRVGQATAEVLRKSLENAVACYGVKSPYSGPRPIPNQNEMLFP